MDRESRLTLLAGVDGAARTIVQNGHPALDKVARRLTKEEIQSEPIQKLVRDMWATLKPGTLTLNIHLYSERKRRNVCERLKKLIKFVDLDLDLTSDRASSSYLLSLVDQILYSFSKMI